MRLRISKAGAHIMRHCADGTATQLHVAMFVAMQNPPSSLC
jgi:hypothetical protein